jgi:hypothetical protein
LRKLCAGIKKPASAGFLPPRLANWRYPQKKEQNQPVANEIPWHIAINLEANSRIHS